MISVWLFLLNVEMELTRIRELTHEYLKFILVFQSCRNGSYPNKGIDTSLSILRPQWAFRSRNGSYPNKGIDTWCHLWSSLQLVLVEMEVTRIRELTPYSFKNQIEKNQKSSVVYSATFLVISFLTAMSNSYCVFRWIYIIIWSYSR